MLIAHITDPHIGLKPGLLTGQVDPTGSLRRALAHVRAVQPAVDVLLLTGDLTDSGQAADYALIAALLDEQWPSGAPDAPRVLAVAGNHDVRAAAHENLARAMPVAPDAPADHICLHAVHRGVHFIGLDTVVPKAPHGALGAEQLDWLARQFEACAGEPVVLFMHHPPLVSGISAMDACGLLHGRAELGRLVAAHGGVQLIAAGHIHRPIVGQLGGAPVVVAPSSSHQLALDLRPGAPVACRLEPPMVGLYRWTPEDGLACHFSHIEAFGPAYLI